MVVMGRASWVPGPGPGPAPAPGPGPAPAPGPAPGPRPWVPAPGPAPVPQPFSLFECRAGHGQKRDSGILSLAAGEPNAPLMSPSHPRETRGCRVSRGGNLPSWPGELPTMPRGWHRQRGGRSAILEDDRGRPPRRKGRPPGETPVSSQEWQMRMMISGLWWVTRIPVHSTNLGDLSSHIARYLCAHAPPPRRRVAVWPRPWRSRLAKTAPRHPWHDTKMAQDGSKTAQECPQTRIQRSPKKPQDRLT